LRRRCRGNSDVTTLSRVQRTRRRSSGVELESTGRPHYRVRSVSIIGFGSRSRDVVAVAAGHVQTDYEGDEVGREHGVLDYDGSVWVGRRRNDRHRSIGRHRRRHGCRGDVTPMTSRLLKLLQRQRQTLIHARLFAMLINIVCGVNASLCITPHTLSFILLHVYSLI